MIPMSRRVLPFPQFQQMTAVFPVCQHWVSSSINRRGSRRNQRLAWFSAPFAIVNLSGPYLVGDAILEMSRVSFIV